MTERNSAARAAEARARRKAKKAARREEAVPDVAFALPHGAPARAVARVVGLAGIVGAVAWMVFEVPGVGMIALGVALVVTALGLRSDDDVAASIAADPRTGAVTLATTTGRSVTLPRYGLLRAKAVEHTSTSSSATGTTSTSRRWVLCLMKKDGGVLQLASFGDEAAARQIADAVEEVLTATEAGATDESADADPLERLEGSPLVEARREEKPSSGYRDCAGGGDAVVSWPAAASPSQWVTLALLLCGIVLAPTGFVLLGASKGFLVLTVLFGAFGVLFVGSTLRDIGVRIQIRVADDGLSIERLRGERCLKREMVPLGLIEAIDVSHYANVRGGAQLAIRLDEAQRAQRQLVEGGSPRDAEGAVAMVRAAYDLHKSSFTAPIARLALPDQIAVDLALSEEVARRTQPARNL